MIENEKEINQSFFDKDLLSTEYVQKHKRAFDEHKNTNPYRNYKVLLDSLNSIYEYKKEHANSFTKRIKSQQKEFKDCEAVFAEIIVYAYYLRLVHEGILKSLDIKEADYDLGVELADGSFRYLEVFCIMPNLKMPSEAEPIVTGEIKTHLQDELSSVRQKLLRKIEKQKQLSQPRENFAVIEMNHSSIAGDFSILSSLSSGYKVNINTKGNKIIGAGFDWSKSIFDKEIVKNLKGIIYFSMGDYGERKFIFNPNFKGANSAIDIC